MKKKWPISYGIAQIRGFGFILWHSRHEFYHVLIGLVWAWILREHWGEFNYRFVLLSVFGSLLPDLDHFWYFLTYGRKAPYTQTIRELIRDRKWRAITVYIEAGHKNNTSLTLHNYYFMGILLLAAVLFTIFSWKAGVVLTGAMILHYLFDIADDLVQIGSVNPNWKRWGREKF
jgi:hypothetical protein